MKKHIIRILTVLLLVCLGAALFAACGETETPQKETYTVTYAAGGGTGTGPASEKYEEGATFKVKENSFTRDGYTFKTWNDGTKDYAAGATYTMPKKDVTFTAQWTEDGGKPEPAAKVTVTYSLGENTTGKAPVAQEVDKGGQVTLPAAPVWEGHTFKGWKVGSDATLKNAGDKITVNENVTVTAQWETAATPVEKVTVTFNLGDNTTGKVPAAQEVEKGKAYTLPAAPDWEGHLFTGWKVGETDEVKKAGETITPNADVTLTAQYKEVSHTITGATIEADEDNQAVYVTIIGSYTGYTEVEIATLLEDDDQNKLCVSICLGEDPWTYQELDFTVDADDDTHVFSVSLDVTDLEGSIPFFVCENRSGSGDIKTVTYDETVVMGAYKYRLHSANGSNLTLNVSAAGKEHAFTGMKLETVENRVYFTISGTYSGYTDDDFKAALEDDDKNNLYVGITATQAAGNLNAWNWPDCEMTVTATGGTFTVKLDVTEIPIVIYYVCENQSGSGDILWNDVFASTVTANEKKYTIEKNGYGNTQLKVEAATPEPPVEGTVDVVGADIAVDEGAQKVYLTLTGTFTGYSEAELKALFEGTNTYYVHFWDEKAGMENPTSVVVTTEGGNWTAKCDVTDLKAGELRNVLCNGELKLDIQDKTVTLGNKTFTLQKANGYGNTGLKVVVETAPTDPVYNLTDITLEKTETVVYFVASGSHNYSDTEQLKTVLNNVKFDFGEISEIEKQIEVTANSWSIKFDVTNLAAQANPYYFHFFSNPADGDIRLQNEHAEDGAFVELAGKKYSIVNKGNGVNTWDGATYWGCVCLKVETTAPAVEVTFSEPTSATLEVMKSDGREDGKLFREEVDAAFLVLTGTYTGDATLELAQDYFSQAKYSFKFTAKEWKDRLRRISIDTSEKTWTVKYDVTSLPVGDNKCVLKGSDLKLTVGEDATKSVKSLGSTFTLTNIAEGVLAVNVKHNYTITGVDLEQDEDGTPRLVMSGTYEEAVWSGDEIKKFLLDDDVRTLCLNLSTYIWPMNDYYSADVTATDGNFTVKLDISRLSPRQNDLVLSEGSGYGDIKNVTVNKTLTVGNKVYTLTGTDGGNCTLTIAEIPKEYSVTTATIEQASEKINLVLSGTYAGYTDAEFTTYLQNVYYDIQHNDNLDKKGWDRLHSFARTASAAEGQWTFTIDITKLNVGSYGIHFDSTDGVGGENENTKNLQPTDTQLNDKTFNIGTKTFKFVYDSSSNKAEYFWGTLGVIVTDTNAATISFTKAQLTSDESHVYLVLTANVNGYTQQDLETMIYIGELDSMRVTVSEVTLAEGVATLKFDFTEQRPNGKWWWGHYMINGLESLNVVCPIDTGSDAKTVTVTVGGYKYTLRHNDEIAASENEQIIITIDPV